MPAPLTLAKKKRIALQLLTSDRKHHLSIQKKEKVSLHTIYRIQKMIDASHTLSPEEMEKDPELKRIYDKELQTWINLRRQEIATLSLRASREYLRNAILSEKIKKESGYRSALTAKILLENALLAGGELSTQNAPTVKIYLPKEQDKEWKVVEEQDGEGNRLDKEG